MKGDRQEYGAPWGRLLKGISGGVVVLFIGIAALGSASRLFILLLPLILVLALPFMVRGYVVEDGALVVKRLGWNTTISLTDLQSVEVVPNAMKSSIRLCGNGGLFSFTGLYRNKALGKFRAFVTDPNRTVVLRFSKRIVVVSPDDPMAFVDIVGE